MKIAISIADELVQQAAALAEREGKSRSQVIAEAVRAWLAERQEAAVTAALNRVEAASNDKAEVAGWTRTASATLGRSEW